MMDWAKKTTETYNSSALELARFFRGIGPRSKDIDRGLKLAVAGNQARVVEIGCGDGRDAADMIKRDIWYQGFDPSEGMLDFAHKKNPKTSFVLADALSYSYPSNIDVVYAFASLLHINKVDLKAVFAKVTESLRAGGIFYISLKYRPTYAEEIVKDIYGQRMFYFYNPDLIKKMAGKSFTSVYEDFQHIGKTDWFTIALKKI